MNKTEASEIQMVKNNTRPKHIREAKETHGLLRFFVFSKRKILRVIKKNWEQYGCPANTCSKKTGKGINTITRSKILP
ncbi:MAG: hypothetical protein ACXVOH_00615 [Bacteroidia bacterium]